jgi:putative hydrolase of the HAD superfamily
MRDQPLIVFDAMGVIFVDPDDVASCLIPFLRERGVGADEGAIDAIYKKASLGRISPRDFWEGLGLGEDWIGTQEEYLASGPRLDPSFLAAADEISGFARLGLLSNDVSAWSARLRAIHGLDGLFSTILISSDAGLRKPDPRIFRAFLAKAGARGENAVFIDDRPANLIAAAGEGFSTILFARETIRNGAMESEGFAPDATSGSIAELAAVAREITMKARGA